MCWQEPRCSSSDFCTAKGVHFRKVFNAETFIIGFCAGAMGIGITLLLLIPANSIIRSLADGVNVKAALPPVAAVVLIGLSVVLTLLGGLIPSRKAAKSDPVTALRTD